MCSLLFCDQSQLYESNMNFSFSGVVCSQLQVIVGGALCIFHAHNKITLVVPHFIQVQSQKEFVESMDIGEII